MSEACASCANCFFWLRCEDVVQRRWFHAPVVTLNPWGYCRRYPRQYGERRFTYPDAHQEDWCGEWDGDPPDDERENGESESAIKITSLRAVA